MRLEPTNQPMRTLRDLPDLQQSRFGSASFGSDVIVRVRNEHAAMRRVVALLCPDVKDPNTLTLDDVARAYARASSLRTEIDEVVAIERDAV